MTEAERLQAIYAADRREWGRIHDISYAERQRMHEAKVATIGLSQPKPETVEGEAI